MATSVEPGGRAAATLPPNESPALTWLVTWVRGHPQTSAAIAAVLIAAGGLGWWSLMSRRRTEAVASERLGQARLAFDSRNYPLAGSELSQVVENYSGTRAAGEAELLLARVRMAQGQGQQAIDLLKRFAPSARSEFRAQAYGLLGAAYEDAAHPKEAATAYEDAATQARFAFLKAQSLSDAGRAWLNAGDTAKALADYRTIVEKMDSTATVAEARVRIGELTRDAGQR